MTLCVDHIRTTFPDCRAIDPTTGDVVNIEFEYRSGGFLVHRKEWHELREAHPRERWLLVCWADNLDDRKKKQLPDLNDELKTQWFTGRENKKKGFDAEALLHGGELVPRFLDVWRQFSASPVERSVDS